MQERVRTSSPSLTIALLVVVASITVGCSRNPPPLNVLIVTFDTTRADRIGCYGRENASTPVVDSLAELGFLFERCYSTNPITTPSHSTIMTGCYPMSHGVRDNGLFTLPDEMTTLAEVFQSNGWATGAAVASFPLTRKFGLDQGFDFFDDNIETPYQNYRGDRIVSQQKLFFDERPAGEVNRAITPWLEANVDRPFFAWIHYFDPHQPHVPPTPYDEEFAGDLYQGEIAYADESLGKILGILEEKGAADRTVVIIVGDHGEGLGDHNELTHSLLCYDTTIRVPLIIKVPGAEGGVRVPDIVGTVDLAPTVLDLVGLPNPDRVQGRSLRPILASGGAEVEVESPAAYYSETLSPRLAHGWSEVRVLVDDPLKYIHSSKPELYDLRKDPAELLDLAPGRPDLAAAMKQKLDVFINEKASPIASDAAGEVDADTMKRLAALGYVSGSTLPDDSEGEKIFDDGEAPQDRAGDVSRWSAAKDAIFSGRFLEAREIAWGLVDENPDNCLYLAILAQAQFNMGQTREALATLERSEPISYHAADLYLAIGRSLMIDGDEERALELVGSVVSEFPSTEGFYTLAGMHKDMGDRDGYRSALTAALDLDPSYTPARVALAAGTAGSGDLAAAETELERALVDGPLYPPAHFNIGLIYLDTGRPAKAASSFDRARSLNRRYWNAYLGLIAARIDLADSTAAMQVTKDLAEWGAPAAVIEQAERLMEDQ